MVLVCSNCWLPSSDPTISDRMSTCVKHSFDRILPDGHIDTIFNQAHVTEGCSHLLMPFPAIIASLHAVPPVRIWTFGAGCFIVTGPAQIRILHFLQGEPFLRAHCGCFWTPVFRGGNQGSLWFGYVFDVCHVAGRDSGERSLEG